MVLHLGDDVAIFTRDIVALFDLTRQTPADTRAFLNAAQEKSTVRRVSKETPKSAVLACAKGGQTLYLSPITTATLTKRVSAPQT